MIVPRSRLLVCEALVVLPCALIGALDPSLAGWCVLLVAVSAAVAGADALLARTVLNNIRVETPETVRLVSERQGEIPLKVMNAGPRSRRLRLGLALPAEIHPAALEIGAMAPKGISRVTWSPMPTRRGRHTLDTVYAETPSPLGLWSKRARLPIRCEIRVYPNLRKERIETLLLDRGDSGAHRFRQIGKGREFEKLRDYVPGDGFDEIDWKATARRGRPITRVFQIERTQEVYAIIDTSRLSARGATLDRFVSASLALALAAEKQGDLFGLVAFGDKLQRFVRASRGRAHFSACQDALYHLEAARVSPDFDELCAFIRLRLRRRALLMFLTELDDPVLAESFIQNLRLISRQHLVLVNMLRPEGARPLFRGAEAREVDDVYRGLAGHMLWLQLREMEKVLGRQGAKFELLDPSRLSAEIVSRYRNVKARQLI